MQKKIKNTIFRDTKCKSEQRKKIQMDFGGITRSASKKTSSEKLYLYRNGTTSCHRKKNIFGKIEIDRRKKKNIEKKEKCSITRKFKVS
jgi:hypothetical protein